MTSTEFLSGVQFSRVQRAWALGSELGIPMWNEALLDTSWVNLGQLLNLSETHVFFVLCLF